MSPSGNQKRKKTQNKDQWLAREIHIKNWTLDFDCTTVNHARKLPRKTLDLLFIDVFQ